MGMYPLMTSSADTEKGKTMSKYIKLEDAEDKMYQLWEEDTDNKINSAYCFDDDRAIEALRSLPTIEASEDCIDRKKLLDQIDIDSEGSPGYYCDNWKFVDTIENAPRVVPIYQPITIKADEKDLEPLKKQLKDIKTTGTLVTEEEYRLFGCRFRTVEHAPSVTTEQSSMVGEWKDMETAIDDDTEVFCSLCGNVEYYTPNYCPNCGAKMRGAE